jgi:hypothetical protein
MVRGLRAACDSGASAPQARLDLLSSTKENFDETEISISRASSTIELQDARSGESDRLL